MKDSFNRILQGYHRFREKYAEGDNAVMEKLSIDGQKPDVMVIACSDSRVDPAVLLQCKPGDLFVVRNVANIVPPCENDKGHHGVSAALEFGVCYLKVKHLVLLGHSQCGGIQALLDHAIVDENHFISDWVKLIEKNECKNLTAEEYSQFALGLSYQNCLTFPWIEERVHNGELMIHQWYFDIKSGKIQCFSAEDGFVEMA